MVRRKTLGKKIYISSNSFPKSVLFALENPSPPPIRKKESSFLSSPRYLYSYPFLSCFKKKKRRRTRVTRIFSQKCKLISIFVKCQFETNNNKKKELKTRIRKEISKVKRVFHRSRNSSGKILSQYFAPSPPFLSILLSPPLRSPDLPS